MDSVLVDDCEDCRLYLGPTTGSVMLRDCKRVEVHAACQQLRTRDCEDLQLFLYCSTDPIIETSSRVRFQTWVVAFPGLTEMFATARLDPANNRYRNIFDFNKSDPAVPEPHFELQPIAGLATVPLTILDCNLNSYPGLPDIPPPLLQMLEGALAPPASTAGDPGLVSLPIEMGQAAAQAMIDDAPEDYAEEFEEDAHPAPVQPNRIIPLPLNNDEVFELENEEEDHVLSPTISAPPSHLLPTATALEGYVPRFALKSQDYQQALESISRLESNLAPLRRQCQLKAQAVDQLLDAILLTI
eukprot:NODE_2031_length_1299_cov_17.297782_g1933_i0.p1 GENE.NODE_2031_length_1299_cov_17.297782_g1933_i0~~NODE_2031_length_1299_cov_17.297782_g1933_i0.p1  ORF type:complete len:300 (-),score=62.28 NODE_2031_length_1299_cov_17.297782_g1933_i0:24-923(-)